MPPTVSIRQATPEDGPFLVEGNLRLAAESESKELDAETLAAGVETALRDPQKGRYFLACVDGRPVGQLMLTGEWSDWRNGLIWWIQSVYVLPEFRRQGVYQALSRHVERLAAERGVVGLRLYVEKDNLPAQGAYRKAAMREAGYIVYERMFDRP